jgi:hypothetical protein
LDGLAQAITEKYGGKIYTHTRALSVYGDMSSASDTAAGDGPAEPSMARYLYSNAKTIMKNLPLLSARKDPSQFRGKRMAGVICDTGVTVRCDFVVQVIKLGRIFFLDKGNGNLTLFSCSFLNRRLQTCPSLTSKSIGAAP